MVDVISVQKQLKHLSGRNRCRPNILWDKVKAQSISHPNNTDMHPSLCTIIVKIGALSWEIFCGQRLQNTMLFFSVWMEINTSMSQLVCWASCCWPVQHKAIHGVILRLYFTTGWVHSCKPSRTFPSIYGKGQESGRGYVILPGSLSSLIIVWLSYVQVYIRLRPCPVWPAVTGMPGLKVGSGPCPVWQEHICLVALALADAGWLGVMYDGIRNLLSDVCCPMR